MRAGLVRPLDDFGGAPMLADAFGRPVRYLRLSVTESCDFHCVYCRPGRAPVPPAGAECTADEVVRLASAFVSMGVRTVRLTGGEPLLRPDLCEILSRLRALDPRLDLALTTNGALLARRAEELKEAGLCRVNVSLDSLEREAFARMAGVDRSEAVLAGVRTALHAGLDPVKLNVVVARGINDEEIPNFVALTLREPLHVRFIELMPIGPGRAFSASHRVQLAEMTRMAGPLEEVPEPSRPRGLGPVRLFRREGAAGSVGFIAALSDPFCEGCNRVRLTSRGRLLPCLAAEEGSDLLTPLRAGADAASLRALIRRAVAAKPSGHAFGGCGAGRAGRGLGMCGIGG